MVPDVIIIIGPTGVGKTDLSLAIGSFLSIEIINIDVGQFYTPLTIGTAKPAWRDAIIPHHLFDIFDMPINGDVVQYRAAVLSLIDEIKDRGAIPVLVGGSGFYVRSLFFPVAFSGHAVNTYRSFDSHANGGAHGNDLWHVLNKIDPERASKINVNDYYRLNRALEQYQQSSLLPSSLKPVFQLPFTYELLYVGRTRSDLYCRIKKRTDIMMDAGWIDEVRSLIGTPWENFLQEKKIIGYNEILSFLKGGASLKDTVDAIGKRTCLYAKRQETYWRYLAHQLACYDDQLGILNKAYSVPIDKIDLKYYWQYLKKRCDIY